MVFNNHSDGTFFFIDFGTLNIILFFFEKQAVDTVERAVEHVYPGKLYDDFTLLFIVEVYLKVWYCLITALCHQMNYFEIAFIKQYYLM